MIRPVTIRAAGLSAIAAIALVGCTPDAVETETPSSGTEAAAELPRTYDPLPEEQRFGELRMLTDGGQNAEAYFSFGSDRLVLQATPRSGGC